MSAIGIGNGLSLFTGAGSPEGVIVASPTSLYCDTAAGGLWIKASGVNTNTGWLLMGTTARQLYKFSGEARGTGDGSACYFGDTAKVISSAAALGTIQFPIMVNSGTFELRATVTASNTANASPLNVERNGVVLASVSIPAGTTGDFAIAPTAGAFIAGTDHLDLSIGFAGGENGKVLLAAMILLS